MNPLECTIDQLQGFDVNERISQLKEKVSSLELDLEDSQKELIELRESHKAELINILQINADFKRGIRTLGEVLQAGKDAAAKVDIDTYVL